MLANGRNRLQQRLNNDFTHALEWKNIRKGSHFSVQCREISILVEFALAETKQTTKRQSWMRPATFPLRQFTSSVPEKDERKKQRPKSPPKKILKSPFVVRLLFPYDSACTILSDEEMKEAIVNFSQQTGVVFTLLASISAGGLFLESLVPVEQVVTAVSSSCPTSSSGDNSAAFGLYSVTHLAHSYFGINIKPVLLKLAAPCFCASTFFNLYGLVNTTNVLGRSQVIPTRYIKDYVLKNSWIVHSSYWVLIPAIGSFGLGVVCAVDHFYGEPLTTFASCSFVSVTALQTSHLVSLGKYTDQVVSEHSSSNR